MVQVVINFLLDNSAWLLALTFTAIISFCSSILMVWRTRN